MGTMKLGEIEGRFADIIWENEPLSSAQLVQLAQEKLSWKKSTTYTVLKRLCERGLFQNVKGRVTSLLSREECYAMHSEEVVNESFDGSLPAFVAAFGSRNRLSESEIDELQQLIDKMRG